MESRTLNFIAAYMDKGFENAINAVKEKEGL
jgi:hypothetical protein